MQQVLLTPRSMREFLLSLIAGVVVLAVCLAQAHTLGNSSRNSVVVGLCATIVNTALLLAAGALAQMYVLPLLSSNTDAPRLLIGVVTVIFLLVAVPLTRLIFRAGYMTSLGAWLVALIVAGALVLGIHTFVQPNADDRPPTCPFVIKKDG